MRPFHKPRCFYDTYNEKIEASQLSIILRIRMCKQISL